MKKERVVIMSEALQKVLKGFVPEMGNEDDLRISRDLTKLYNNLKSIDCVAFREIQKRKRGVLTSKMRDIQRDEEYLVQRIFKRNLDF